MKISWNDTSRIERYLDNELSNPEKILFEAQLLLDSNFKVNVSLLRQIQSIIKLYGRRKMKAEIGNIHRKLFQDPEHLIFQQRIKSLF